MGKKPVAPPRAPQNGFDTAQPIVPQQGQKPNNSLEPRAVPMRPHRPGTGEDGTRGPRKAGAGLLTGQRNASHQRPSNAQREELAAKAVKKNTKQRRGKP